uniref:Solute carrier family 2, facilitated glucose transporter member 1 n=1 Tax=Lygus hesperus TaxID=30085 RepID=A0A146LZR5_LYGHE
MSREGSVDSDADGVGFIMESRGVGASTMLLTPPGESVSRSPSPFTTRAPRKPPPQGGLTGRLVFTIAAAAFGSAFQHGYNTGVVNAPAALIQKWISQTIDINQTAEINGTLTENRGSETSQITVIWSIIVSVFCVGGMIGGSIVGIVADRLGRKMGLIYNNIFVVLAVLCECSAKWLQSYQLIIIGRFFIGLNSGLNAGLVPVYLNEVSPANLKGAVGTVYQFVITISIMISQLLGMESVLGTEGGWPLLFGLTLVPAIIQLITFPICPESPKHILKTTGNELQAKQVLVWLRGTLDVHSEMEAMKAEHEADKNASRVTLRELTGNPSLRMPLIICVTLMIAQQFSGINAVMYFSTKIFMMAGLSDAASQQATLGVGAMNVMMTFVSLVVIEKAGRKTLLLAGFAGMFVSTLLITVSMAINIAFLTYLSVAGTLLFVLFFSIGPGSIPWFITSELFSVAARPTATGVAVVINWTANFIVGIGFLPLANLMGSYVFLVFAISLALFTVFIWFKVPETKDRTIEEISTMFRQASYQ